MPEYVFKDFRMTVFQNISNWLLWYGCFNNFHFPKFWPNANPKFYVQNANIKKGVICVFIVSFEHITQLFLILTRPIETGGGGWEACGEGGSIKVDLLPIDNDSDKKKTAKKCKLVKIPRKLLVTWLLSTSCSFTLIHFMHFYWHCISYNVFFLTFNMTITTSK